MLALETSPDTFVAWGGGPTQPIDDVVWNTDIERTMTEEELAAMGLYVIHDTAIPEGKVITATYIRRIDGVVCWDYDLEDKPLPSLSMRQLRLGLLGAGRPVSFIQDVIDAIPDAMQRAIATIWYEETDTVEWEHTMTQTLMAAAGISEAEGKAMWIAASQIQA